MIDMTEHPNYSLKNYVYSVEPSTVYSVEPSNG